MAISREADDPHDGLSIVNAYPRELQGPSLLHDLIFDGDDGRPALEYHDKSGPVLHLSYGDLHERTFSLAQILSRTQHNSSSSSSSSNIVPLLIPQTPALYISQIAVLKSGAAFCPLNLDIPDERLRFILNDVSASVVITTPELKSSFDALPDLTVIVLDLDGSVLESRRGASLPRHDSEGSSHRSSGPADVSHSDPAYIMYTSGSTGTPKAVSISHKAVTQSLLAHNRFIPQFSRHLQFANPTFDVSIYEIYFPLFRGATLVVCDRSHLLGDLPAVITDLEVDAAELTPSVVASLLRIRANVPKLKVLLTIGEMLNPQTVREFAASGESDGILYGMYGPTEAAIHCTLQPMFKQSDTINTIGIPLETVSCFVIETAEDGRSSSDIRILPIGDVGELAVGGQQLADGYLNRAEQTDEVFVRHPKYGRLYRTGDKARLTKDGVLECLGRIAKGQVKLRGQRIELGEVEHATSKLSGVHASSATVIEGQLVLFCVADPAQVLPDHVRASCQKWLPQFMVPNDILVLRDFPYMPSGKVDAKKLEADYLAAREKSGPNDNAGFANSEVLSTIRDLLGIDVSSRSSLASAGVDSLQAIKLASELRRKGLPQMSAVEILSSNTVEELSQMIASRAEEDRSMGSSNLEYTATKQRLHTALEKLPTLSQYLVDLADVNICTPIQDAMLLETAKSPKAYCNVTTIALPAETSFQECKRAFQRLADQHAILRSGFIESPLPQSLYTLLKWTRLEDSQISEGPHETAAAFELRGEEAFLRPLKVVYLNGGDSPRAMLCMHHALYDQWSLDIIQDDLYKVFHEDNAPTRPQFDQVIVHTHVHRHNRSRRIALHEFWRHQLQDAIPTRLPRLTGKNASLWSSASLSKPSKVKTTSLSRLAASYGVSLPVPVQAAATQILALYSGQTDTTVGNVFSGRTAAIEGIADLIGPLLCTLPVRTRLSEIERFKDLCVTVNDTNRKIMLHADLPLAEVNRAAGIDTSNSLFDTIFVWQGTPRERIEQESVRLVSTSDYVEFSLVLEVEPQQEHLLFKATYREDIFLAQQVGILIDQIDSILQSVISAPDSSLDEAIGFNDDDLRSIHNSSPDLLDCSGGLPGLLKKTFAKHKDDIALCFATDITMHGIDLDVLTYAELDKRANRICHYLLAAGLKPGSLAAVIIEKGVTLYVSILAVVKAGCGYLPVVPSTPRDRIATILQESGVETIMCDMKSSELVAKPHHVFERIDVKGCRSDEPAVVVDPHSVAYAVYTSGTTGKPKGVLVTHENIVSNLQVLQELYPVERNSRLLQACNQAFDVSVFEIFFAWITGSCLCSAANDVLFRDLEESIRRLDITHLSLTPTVAALIHPENTPSVKFLVTAGEAVTPQVHRAWAGRGLFQGYGPSETTNICTVNTEVHADHAINNIGPSFRNTSTFVLPTSGGFKPLPRGALGELCFGGQQVFQGYRNMPELNAEKIIDHLEYGRIYRSGDLGRMTHDGTLLIEGRTDTQRKIRGQRIELGEIVSTMLRSEDVMDATVLVIGPNGGEKLVAFSVLKRHQSEQYQIGEPSPAVSTTLQRLVRLLEEELPTYMIPSFIIPITSFPRTYQAKIDHKRLLEDAESLPPSLFTTSDLDISTEEDLDFSDLEKQLRDLAAETLRINSNSIQRSSSLVGHGLDSISAIKFASKVRAATGKLVNISAVLKHPRVSQLASLIQDLPDSASETNGHVSSLDNFLAEVELRDVCDRCRKAEVPLDRVLPCTPLQEAMLSASLGPAAHAYLNRTVLKLKVNAEKLRKAWERVAREHETLRTIFISTQNPEHPFVQVILSDSTLPWSMPDTPLNGIDLLGDATDAIGPAVDSMELPYRLSLHRHSDDDYLAIDMHHALYDANALSVLLSDVETVLSGGQLGHIPKFDDFLDYQLSTKDTEADYFFDELLRGYSPRPIRSSTSEDKSFATEHIPLEVTATELQAYQQEHSVSLLAVCQAAWAQVLGVLQDESDVCFGNVVSGRSVPVKDVDRLVAPCFNSVPVRVDTSAVHNYLDLVTKLHQLNIDMLPHQLTALRRIQHNTSGGKTLFNSLVLLQQSERTLDAGIWTFVGETGDMDLPCIVEIAPHEGTFSLHLHYQRSLFAKEQTAHEICVLFCTTLSTILRYPTSDFWSSNTLIENLTGTLKSASNTTNDDTGDDDGSSEWSKEELIILDALHPFSHLERGQVTRHTTIHRMGLDSISAIQVATKLKKQGYNIVASDILERPTPASLATILTKTDSDSKPMSDTGFDFEAFSSRHWDAVCDAHNIDQNSVAAVRPCTAVQAGMLASFLQSKGANYLNHIGYELDETITKEQLVQAWEAVIDAHEMLRTGFVEIDDPKFSFAMITYKRGCKTSYDTIRDCITVAGSWEDQHRHLVFSMPHIPTWRQHMVRQDDKMRLFMSVHHALYDAASWTIILRDLKSALKGQVVGIEPTIEGAISHIIGQSQRSGSNKDFWTKSLERSSPIRFPNLHPVIPKTTQILDFTLQCSQSREALEEHSRERGVSLQAVFQLAWARVLSAYTGEQQVIFGVVHSGRSDPVTHGSCFPCINTLPLTCDTSEDDDQLLTKLTLSNVAAQRHCFTPLSAVQHWAGLANETLFDTIFAFQKDVGCIDGSDGWTLIHEKTSVDYAVSIEVEHQPDYLSLRATFDETVLPLKQANTMLLQVDGFVNAILEIDGQGHKKTDLLSVMKPKTPVIATDIVLTQHLVDRSRVEYPDKVALEFVHELSDDQIGSHAWTYAELDEKGLQVAHVIFDHGGKPGDVVGMSFDKCPEASFAFLGILKAGCTILAIDSTAPQARKEFTLKDSKASVLLCSPSVASDLAGTVDTQVVNLAEQLTENVSCEAIDLQDYVTPESVCYILYTSGTTGTPKGCELTHENTVQLLLAFQQLFQGRWTEESVWLQFASYHFDVAVLEHFWTWSVGMKLVCAPRDLILEDIAEFINRLQVTHLDLTPSLGRLLDPCSVPSLHGGVFITGGEAVKPEMLQAWGEIGCLFNFYGPTECTIGVTTYPSVPTNAKTSNIGWQFDNVGTCVLRPEEDEPVLQGAIGELCIFGKLVGKGYLNRADMNKKSFPFSKSLEERIYRTGDLVRLLHDGSFEFLGRADGQVKLRGQRLEVDEIISVMLQDAVIKDAACVVAKQEGTQNEQLVAFLAASAQRRQGDARLLPVQERGDMIEKARSLCQTHLAAYMVPTRFLPIEFIPLSVNNKQDDKSLKQLYKDNGHESMEAQVASTLTQRELTDLEARVATVLRKVLGDDFPDIRADSNMFALGLSSISAVQFARRLKKSGFTSVDIATVMKNATISSLAHALSEGGGTVQPHAVLAAKQSMAACRQKNLTYVAEALGCSPQDVALVAPCTPLQQGIIYRSMNSENGLYFNRFIYDISNVDIVRLKDVWSSLIKAVDMLRVAFIETEDGHIQVSRRENPIDWTVVRASGRQEAQKHFDDTHQQWINNNKEILQTPLAFTLCKDPGANEAALQICIHHALYDGNSWDHLEQRVTQLYHDVRSQSPVSSFFETLPYGPLLQVDGWQEFWSTQLENATFEAMERIGEGHADRDVLVSSAIEANDDMEQRRKDLQVTTQALVQAAWLLTIATFHRGPVGLVVSGRSLEIEADNVIGPLFNTIPFAWWLDASDTWSTLAKRCHDFNIGSMPYQHTPLRDISRRLGRSSAEPLFETLFVFQQPQEEGELDNVLKPWKHDEEYKADYPLSFEAEQKLDGTLQINLGAQGGIADRDDLKRLISEFAGNLRSLLSDSSASITIPERALGQRGKRAETAVHGIDGDKHDSGVFSWTNDAQVFRKELAGLASVELETIDHRSSIFGLGLDSIDAVKLSARLKKQSISIPVSTIMRGQTIPRILQGVKKVAPRTHEQSASSEAQNRTELLKFAAQQALKDAGHVEDILPATPMQEGLISEMLKSEFKAYFNHDVLEIQPDIVLHRLGEAWQTVIRSSPILRTAFIPIDDPQVESTFAQVILQPKHFQISHIDVNGDNFALDAVLENVRKDVAAHGSSKPPFYLSIVRQGPKSYLVLSMAHALYDGYSLSLLHADVAAAYHGEYQPRPSYAALVNGASQATQKMTDRFWQGLLNGVPSTVITTRNGHSGSITYRREIVSTISSSKLDTFSRTLGITVQAVCQTAWAFVLAWFVQSLDITYGLVLAGRNDSEAERLLFPTMNTVATRIVINGTAANMLKTVQGGILEIMPHQQTPLRHIHKIARQVGNLDDGPLFNTLFTYQKSAQARSDQYEQLYKSVSGSADVDYPCAIEAEIVDDSVIWRLAAKDTAFDENGTADILDRVDKVLSQLVMHPAKKVLDFTDDGISVMGQSPFKLASLSKEDMPLADAHDDESEQSKDWSETETNIREAIALVAKMSVEEVAKNSKLDNLGIDSISVIKLASILRRKSINLSVSKIIQAGTLTGISRLAENKGNEDDVHSDDVTEDASALIARKGFTASSFGLQEADIEAILPVSAGQVYLLATLSNSRGSLFYPTFTHRLHGVTDSKEVRAAWTELVSQHAILRSVFTTTDDAEVPYIQAVLKTSPSGSMDWHRSQPLADLHTEATDGGINLSLHIAHALYDAISLEIIFEDLIKLVRGQQLVRSQRTFERFISRQVSASSKQSQEDFWSKYLEGLKTSPANRHYSGPRTDAFDPGVLPWTDKAAKELRLHGLSVQSLLFAAYAQQYAELRGIDGDVVIGIYLANRSHDDELSTLVAPTLNLLPLRVNKTNTSDIVSLAKQIQHDLPLISDPINGGAGLWEIHAWTGVTLDTFVNFVKLPESTDGQNSGAETIRIESLDEEREWRKRAAVHAEKSADRGLPKELQNSWVQQTYPPTIDVEAMIRDGKLALGVFGYESVVDLEMAGSIISGITRKLRDAIEQ